MPSPRLAAAALRGAAPASVLERVQRGCAPRLRRGRARTSSARRRRARRRSSSTTGRPLSPTRHGRFGAGDRHRRDRRARPCAADRQASPTAARESAGFLEVITTAAFSSSRLAPLAKIPAEPIQLAKSRRACGAVGAPSTRSGVSSPCSSPLRLIAGGAFRAGPPSVLAERDERLQSLDVLAERRRRRGRGRSPARIRPGSSPSACAPCGSTDQQPARLPAGARREGVGVERQRAGGWHERDVRPRARRRAAPQQAPSRALAGRTPARAGGVGVDVGQRARRRGGEQLGVAAGVRERRSAEGGFDHAAQPRLRCR